MTHSPEECPKCDGPMQEGFILDRTYGGLLVSQWIAGPPEPSFWLGTKIRDKPQYPIQSYRCTQCGYLESYANAK